MQWFVPETADHRVAPNFRLSSPDGQTVSRAQFRQHKHLVLIFAARPDAPGIRPLLDALAAARDELKQASGAIFLISPRAQDAPLPLLIDPDDAVRRTYAALLPAPDDSDPFLVILNRYGVPEFTAQNLDGFVPETADAAAQDVTARVWGLEYQCSL